MGCHLKVDDSDKNNIKVSGNTCPRGDKYAREEVVCPKRMVTSIVEVEGGTVRMVSVKTSASVPKDKMFDVLEAIRNISVKAPVKKNQVILADVLGTGIDFVATKDVPKREIPQYIVSLDQGTTSSSDTMYRSEEHTSELQSH